MPAEPPTRTLRDTARWGHAARNAARYLWQRAPGYGWHVAADLTELADLIDPKHRDEAMSQRGRNTAALCDLFVAANSRIGDLEKQLADLTAKLTTATAEDPEDAAADARVAELIAAPVAADPAAPAAPVVPPVSPAAPTLDPAGATTFTVTPAAK